MAIFLYRLRQAYHRVNKARRGLPRVLKYPLNNRRFEARRHPYFVFIFGICLFQQALQCFGVVLLVKTVEDIPLGKRESCGVGLR